jgi:hypothetical protein
MNDGKNIDGHYFPVSHAGWGGFAEELFHHTSRYYTATEAFLRNLAGQRGFSMGGYQPQALSAAQREVLAAVLAARPDKQGAAAAIELIELVLAGSSEVPAALAASYPPVVATAVSAASAEPHPALHVVPADVAPLDPFLSLAEGLQMPVAIRDRHVEVSLHQLAQHLDAGNTTLRDNLQGAVIKLHEAGFVLRNHPHLTHAEARSISGDE